MKTNGYGAGFGTIGRERGKLPVIVAVAVLLICGLFMLVPSGADAESATQVTNADNYTYEDYTYVGDRTVSDGNVVSMTYDVFDADTAVSMMNDFARFMGAVYRANSEQVSVTSVTYDGVQYTWDAEKGLKGSNWVDAQGAGGRGLFFFWHCSSPLAE